MPADSPHTDPDELLETVDAHIGWLRRPFDLARRADTLQDDLDLSADYLERLVAALHAMSASWTGLVAERDALRAGASAAAGLIRDVIAHLEDGWHDDKIAKLHRALDHLEGKNTP